MDNVIDLTRDHQGSFFSCEINGIYTDGRIQWERGEYFLCQNIKEGNSCEDKFGYPYSWSVGPGRQNDIKRNNVTNFSLDPSSILTQEELISRHTKNVIKYISKNLNSTLWFDSWNFDPDYRFTLPNVEYFILDEMDKLIITIIYLAKRYQSHSEGMGSETRAGAARSAIDIWRHAKQFIPEIDIFTVMRSLYKLIAMGILAFHFCGTVKRVVFYFRSEDSSMYKLADEFGSNISYWKDIKE